jgi:cell division septal protein FtsQ
VKSPKKNLIWVGVVAILAILILASPGLIPVNKVSCESQFGPCRAELEESLKASEGKSLKEARRRITSLLDAEVLVQSFDVRFKLPATLEVVLIEKKPVYAIRDLEKKAIALLDKEGYIVAIVPSTNLPTLNGTSLGSGVGEKIESEKLFALEIVSEMFKLYGVKEGSLENDGLSLKLATGAKVVFPLQGEKGVLISSLQVILLKIESEEEAKGVPSIDLRFKNPVITY